MLERRDQRAGLADSGRDLGFHSELHDARLGIATAHGVRRHVEVAAIDALDAPDAGVVVQRRALTWPPDHRDDGVSAGRIAMQEPARVAIGRRFEEARVEVEPIADQADERVHHLATTRLVVPLAHRVVEPLNQLCETDAHRVLRRGYFIRVSPPAGADFAGRRRAPAARRLTM